MILYSTVADEAVCEQIIEKSRFIAHIKPARTREDADLFIAEIRKNHSDATHNVPAMVIGDRQQTQWASDDGEPQGTSGAPIVRMMVSEGITNAVIVVTRYFGGIKLGTGGLVRAYTGSAKAALEAAGICDVKEMAVVTYTAGYSDFEKIHRQGLPFDVGVSDICYADKVSFSVTCDPDVKEVVKKVISDISKGSAALIKEDYSYKEIKRV